MDSDLGADRMYSYWELRTKKPEAAHSLRVKDLSCVVLAFPQFTFREDQAIFSALSGADELERGLVTR
jgi:hypothetical protein